MPPYSLWLRGAVDIGRWMLGPGIGCRGSRMMPVAANGTPACAHYKPSRDGTRLEPWAIHHLEVVGGRVSQITNFLDTRLFGLFGLPPWLER